VEALLASGGVAVSSSTQLTVGDGGTLANALPTQDAPRRGIMVAPPGELLGDEAEAELTAGGRPAASPLPAALPGIEEAAPDSQVSRASAQPTVHPGEPLEGGESPVLGVLEGAESASATAAAGESVLAGSSEGGLAGGSAAEESSEGGLAGGASQPAAARGGGEPPAPA
jgi:hypothetical protein